MLRGQRGRVRFRSLRSWRDPQPTVQRGTGNGAVQRGELLERQEWRSRHGRALRHLGGSGAGLRERGEASGNQARPEGKGGGGGKWRGWGDSNAGGPQAQEGPGRLLRREGVCLRPALPRQRRERGEEVAESAGLAREGVRRKIPPGAPLGSLHRAVQVHRGTLCAVWRAAEAARQVVVGQEPAAPVPFLVQLGHVHPRRAHGRADEGNVIRVHLSRKVLLVAEPGLQRGRGPRQDRPDQNQGAGAGVRRLLHLCGGGRLRCSRRRNQGVRLWRENHGRASGGYDLPRQAQVQGHRH
mmetsp:Transcript_6831/g.23506  ORF Transcript_6831/g.23506 Transcript_6831/m.23506 type:complete len:297 (+) Transcript_6831:460-1350(+)